MSKIYLPLPTSLSATFESGQCFRFKPEPEGYRGVAGNRPAFLQTAPGGLFITPGTKEGEDASFWHTYFDGGFPYQQAGQQLSLLPALQKPVLYGQGMRLLRQEGFETLITFLLSQNNHMGRIAGLVEKLCTAYGAPVPAFGRTFYAFPKPERLAAAGEQALRALGLGYRAAYVCQAAGAVANGQLVLEPLATLPLSEAIIRLTAQKGIGPKVAQCVLLFGFGRKEAFPVDTWIRRVMRQLTGNSRACEGELEREGKQRYRDLAGLAGQYLFYYARCGQEIEDLCHEGM